MSLVSVERSQMYIWKRNCMGTQLLREQKGPAPGSTQAEPLLSPERWGAPHFIDCVFLFLSLGESHNTVHFPVILRGKNKNSKQGQKCHVGS